MQNIIIKAIAILLIWTIASFLMGLDFYILFDRMDWLRDKWYGFSISVFGIILFAGLLVVSIILTGKCIDYKNKE